MVTFFNDFDGDFIRNDQAHELFPSPQRLRFQDSRMWELSWEKFILSARSILFMLYPDDEVHNFLFGQEGVSHGEKIKS